MQHRVGTLNARRLLSVGGFYVVLILLVIFFAATSRQFLTLSNMRDLFLSAAPLMAVTAGMGLLLIAGSLDLSVAGVALACGSVLVALLRAGVPPWAALIIMLTLGAALGSVNGFLVNVLGTDAMLTTLGMMILLRGVSYPITGGWVVPIKDAVKNAALGTPAFFPNIVWVAIGIMIVVQVVLAKTVFGRRIVALGSSQQAARQMGVRIKRMRFALFTISGVCASMAGLFFVTKVGSVDSQTGTGTEFVALAALVLGGVSLDGGRGSIIPGAFLGVLMLGIIENGMYLVTASPYAFPVIRGLIIFVAAAGYALAARSGRLPVPLARGGSFGKKASGAAANLDT